MSFVDKLKDKEAHKSFAKRLLNDSPFGPKKPCYSAMFMATSIGASCFIASCMSLYHDNAKSIEAAIEKSPGQNAAELLPLIASGFAIGYLLTFSQFTTDQKRDNTAPSR